MRLLFVNDAGDHLGCLEFDGEDSVTIKKYKPEFDPQVVDAPEEDDMDDAGAKEPVDPFKAPVEDSPEEEAAETPEVEEEEDAAGEKQLPMGKMKKPMKFKGGKGMF